MRERGNLWSCESVVQQCLFFEWNLERFLVLANQFDDCSLHEHRKSFIYLLKVAVDESSLSLSLLFNRIDALKIALRLSARLMLENLYNEPRNIHLYDGVAANILVFNTLKNWIVTALGLRRFLSADRSASSEDILQQQVLSISVKYKRILGADENVAGEMVELTENKQVDVSVYLEAQRRLGSFAFETSRIRMGSHSRGQERAEKSPRAEARSVSGFLLSDTSLVEGKNVLMDTASDDTQGTGTDGDTALLRGALQKYSRHFQCPFQELPDYREQGGFDMKVKIKLILTHKPYNVPRELWHQTSDTRLWLILWRRHFWDVGDAWRLSKV